MGLIESLDNLVHGGPKPDSYERKKKYNFGEELGKHSIMNQKVISYYPPRKQKKVVDRTGM